MDDSEDEDGPTVSLTGFLFGNVDTKTGKLEDESVFGIESDKQIRALESLGLGFQTVLSDEDDDDGRSVGGIGDANFEERGTASKKKHHDRYDSSDDDYDESEDEPAEVMRKKWDSIEAVHYDESLKSTTAIDFSTETECIEEEDNMSELEFKTTFGDYVVDYDLDKQKMPPPPPPSFRDGDGMLTYRLPSTSLTETKLETPLASILPSKYAGVSVTTLFPDFRPDKVLRFSRLFGPGKFNSLPHIWKNVRKRRQKKKEKLLEEQNTQPGSSTGVTTPGIDMSSLPEPSLNQVMFPTASDMAAERRKEKLDWENRYKDDEIPHPSQCVTDEEEVFCRPHEATEDSENSRSDDGLDKSKIVEKKHLWRHGPAAIWFEMLGVPDNPEHFEYGFKKKVEEKETDSEEDSSDEEKKKAEVVYPDDSYNMVTQSDWEEAIIWDSQDAKTKKLAKNKTAGWVPSGSNRSAQSVTKSQDGILSTSFPAVKMATPSTSFTSVASSRSTASKKSSKTTEEPQSQPDDTWYSIFPVEANELVNGHWEKDIIWDVDQVEELPEPKVLELDPNDENIILCIPDDVDPNASQSTSTPIKVKIPHPHVKKSKILLGKAGVINVIEEDSPPPSPKDDDKDPYNLSLDEYYQAKHTEQALIKISTSGNIIQHSTPVVELRAPFVPTHMNLVKLRNFHRPALRKLNNGLMSQSGPHALLPLSKHIQIKAKQREAERQAAGGGDIFFMRTPEDFSCKDGELLLVEYSEEHPPLLNQVGMCSKIKNYYKRKAGKADGPEHQTYGETVNAHTSPFLGAMHPGEMIQTIENNMFRSAIFPHDVRSTDFLVVRTRNNLFIRTFEGIFTAAQECPLYEVPGPNSKRANNFVRDFLQVFIYRLFWSSRDSPRRIRMDDIKKAFPMHSESSIRKRLKLCADFKRTGTDSNWWVIKPEFRLPTEEEFRAMVTPEQCCAYFSLIAAEQRLKDAGYGTQSILAPLPEEEDETEEKKLDDEVKVAPWNTTRAYIQAIKGKCILQINGPADPTGCGEGFSYVRMPNKPQTTVEEKETQPKRIVTGTDADLRRLSLNNAKALLRKFGVPEDEIQKLSRWEVIDVVRTLSTEKAKAGEKGMTKFSRGNRFSVAEHQERYKEECQRIFEVQNRVLQSSEALSTDEGESTEEEEDNEDIEEMGKNIEHMLSNKKTSSQLHHEKEEAERKELQRMIMGDGKDEKEDEKNPRKKAKMDEDNKTLHGLTMHPGRILKIQRKYKNADGKEFIRTEIVRKSHIIDIYVSIRTTKDESWIRQFTLNDEQIKEEMKKEKRRIQEQLRRMKRNQDKPMRPLKRYNAKKVKKVKVKPELKVKCGACGQVGHMKTNKACPYYDKSRDPLPSVNVAMTEEEEQEMGKRMLTEVDIGSVKVEGTKVALSSKLWKQTDAIKRRSLVLKVPKEFASLKGRRKRSMNADSLDYMEGKAKGTNRRRIDPQVLLSNTFEMILNDLRDEPDSSHFHFPVSQKLPKYYEIIEKPMDLQTIRDKNRDREYQTGADFLADVALLMENSANYNGESHIVTSYGKKLVELAKSKLKKDEKMLSLLEKQINPLLDENDKHRLLYILRTILDKVKLVPQAGAFLKPVNKKLVKDYYEIVTTPMDLETMERKLNDALYVSRHDFLSDFVLLQSNSERFNGQEHTVTISARYVVNFVKSLLDDLDEPLMVLEANIQRVLLEGEDDAGQDEEYDEEYSLGAEYFVGNSNDEDVIEESIVTMDEFQVSDNGEIMTDSKKRVLRRESGELSSSDEEQPGPSKRSRYT